MSIIADSRTWIAPNPQSMPIYILPQLTRTNLPNLQKTMRILKNVNPDLVHLHAQYHYSPAMILPIEFNSAFNVYNLIERSMRIMKNTAFR